MGDNNKAEHQTIQELAGAVTTQAQVTNRVWLALATVVAFALIHRAPGSDSTFNLPFGFGSVERTTFSTSIYLMLAVLSIAFSSAYAQQFRAQLLAHEFLDSAQRHGLPYGGVYPREWFDLLRLPTFNRVSPLPQLLRGRCQFYSTKAGCPGWLRLLTTIYYAILKFTSLIVYFGVPGYALVVAYPKGIQVGLWRWGVRIGLVLALASLAQVCLADIISLKRILPQIYRGERESGADV